MARGAYEMVAARAGSPARDWRGWQLGGAAMLAVLAAAAQCLSMGAVAIVASVGIAAIAVVSPLNVCLVELYVCLPFFNVMNHSVGSTSLYYLLTGVFILKCLVSGDVDHRRARILVAIGLVLVTIYNLDDLYGYVRWLLLVVPLVMTAGSEVVERELGPIVFWYSVSSVASALFGIYLSDHGLMELTTSYVYVEGGQNTMRFGGLVGDPVMFSETLVVLVACNLALLLAGRGTATNGLCALALSLVSVLSYSKTALALLAVLFVFSACYVISHQLLDRRRALAGILALCLLGAIGALAVLYVANNPNSDIVSTFQRRFDTGDLMTGRFDLWGRYWDWIERRGAVAVFGGVGFLSYDTVKFPFQGLMLMRCHNVYLETVLLFGVLEAIAVLVTLVFSVASAVRRGAGVLAFLPLATLLAFGFVLHGHTESFYYFLWILTLGVMGSGRFRRAKGAS